MPTVDDRLEQLFAAAAVEPTRDGDVFRAVTRKRHQRRTRRVARNVAVTIVAVVALAGSLAWLATDHRTRPAVAPTTIRNDAWRSARPIILDRDVGYVRGPLITSGADVTIAAYDRSGSGFKVPPSRVVRIDAADHVIDEVELQGEILSLADGEGARWVVTHDADNVPDRRYRVKRIGIDGTVLSNAFPAGVEPSGPIVVGSGAAWVPVEHGVLRFDATTGAYVATVAAPDPDRMPRLVRLGTHVSAYSMFGSELVDLDTGRPDASTAVSTDAELLSVTSTSRGAWALTSVGGRTTVAPLRATTGDFDRTRALHLPKRFSGSELQVAGDTLWVVGRLDDQPALVRVDIHDDGSVVTERPVVLGAPADSDVVLLPGNQALVAADGVLYRVDLH